MGNAQSPAVAQLCGGKLDGTERVLHEGNEYRYEGGGWRWTYRKTQKRVQTMHGEREIWDLEDVSPISMP